LRWKLEGSTNGIQWFTVQDQTTDYPYPTGTRPFYTPGIFPIGATPQLRPSNTPDLLNNTDLNTYNTNRYSSSGLTTITEGFVANLLKPSNRVETMKFVEPPVALENSYSLPLKMERPLDSKRVQIIQKRRIQYLRLKFLETQDPTSKFVNISQLEFHTRAGLISPSCFKLSNPQGSRKSPKEGVNGLLGSRSSRWVDYNKSELMIHFDTEILPAQPIIGFKFSVPAFSGGLEAFPSKWILLGSYDGRQWITLYDQSDFKGHIIGVSTPVYKLYEEI
jgi:hypothetical protein